MKVCALVRVSSKAQDVATQRSAIEKSAAARGMTIDEWYVEKASGRSVARPELDRLRRDCRAGLVSNLFLFRLDRITRSGIRDTLEVVEELRSAGCVIHTIADGFSLDGPAADVILAVMAWSAKMERLAINERIAAARERLQAEGRPWGRPPRMTPGQIEQAHRFREAGRSIREIAVALKVPRSTISDTLAVRKTSPGGARSDSRSSAGFATGAAAQPGVTG